MPPVGRRSRALTENEFPEITWEHSHVIVDDEGLVHTYCVYEAPSEEIVREHSKHLGQHTLDESVRDRRRRDAGRLPTRLAARLAALLAAEPEQLRVADVVDRLLGDGEPLAEEADAIEVVGGRHVERLLVQRDRVLLRPAALGLFGSRDEVLDGVLELAGAAPVAGKCRAGLADLGRRLPR